MEPIVGIFSTREEAQRARAALAAGGLSADRIELLMPGRLEEFDAVPTEEAEQSGVGHAVAGVVGGAAGASAGFGIGAVTASLIPGIGPVIAVGLAAAALLGAAGAAGGVAAGKALEDSTRSGIPRDELYLYGTRSATARASSSRLRNPRSRKTGSAASSTRPAPKASTRRATPGGSESATPRRLTTRAGQRTSNRWRIPTAGASWPPCGRIWRERLSTRPSRRWNLGWARPAAIRRFGRVTREAPSRRANSGPGSSGLSRGGWAPGLHSGCPGR